VGPFDQKNSDLTENYRKPLQNHVWDEFRNLDISARISDHRPHVKIGSHVMHANKENLPKRPVENRKF
ncbi:hypothetical protein BpHYR1_026696, partial [Brachionus plicatilis]